MLFYCSIAISSFTKYFGKSMEFYSYYDCMLKLHIRTEAEMCNKIYVSLYEYFINIEYFALFFCCIYYNSINISEVAREKNMHVNFLLSWFWYFFLLFANLFYSRATLFTLFCFVSIFIEIFILLLFKVWWMMVEKDEGVDSFPLKVFMKFGFPLKVLHPNFLHQIQGLETSSTCASSA